MNLNNHLRFLSVALLLMVSSLVFAQEQRAVSFVSKNQVFTQIPEKKDSVNSPAGVQTAERKFDLVSLRQNPNYGLVEDFKEGFSRIQKNQVYGFLDITGKEVVTPQYDYADAFNSGKALVKKFYWYFINSKGEESDVLNKVIDAKAFRGGISVVKFENGKMALIDNSYDASQKAISAEFDEISVLNNNRFIIKKNNKFGLIDVTGEQKLAIEYDKIKKINESDDWMIIEKDRKQGLVDISGEAFIKTDYDKIETFSMISVGDKAYLNLLATNDKGVRLIEINNRQISETYQKIEEFNQFGLAKVYKKDITDKFGFIDFTGKEIITTTYLEVGNFNRMGLLVATNLQKESTLFDFRGNAIFSAKPHIQMSLSDTLFAANTMIIKLIEPTNIVKFHLIDKKTMRPITPEPYAGFGRFGSYFMFMQGNKWGLMERNGVEVLKPIYDDILFESEGILGVKYENEKLGFIDKKGKIKGTFDYQTITPFQNGLAVVSKGNNKMGVINTFNAKIIPLVFKSVSRENSVFVVNDTSEKFIINYEGNCLENCEKYNNILIKLNKR